VEGALVESPPPAAERGTALIELRCRDDAGAVLRGLPPVVEAWPDRDALTVRVAAASTASLAAGCSVLDVRRES
jgi:hypothetical protein